MSGAPDFDALYRADADPWSLATSPHELRKYARTIEALGGRRFGRAFEPGCSVGVLTAMLAQRCDDLVASDVSPVAVEQAARRAPTADVSVGSVPEDWPTGSFDLVVLSELLYYLPADRRADVLTRTATCLGPDGLLLAVHWVHPFEDSFTDGAACHREIADHPGLRRVGVVDDPDHLIQTFRPAGRAAQPVDA